MYRAWAAPCKAKQTAPDRLKNVKIAPKLALRNENRRQIRIDSMAPCLAGGIHRVEIILAEATLADVTLIETKHELALAEAGGNLS